MDWIYLTLLLFVIAVAVLTIILIIREERARRKEALYGETKNT